MGDIRITNEFKDLETGDFSRRSFTISPANDYEDSRTLDIGTSEETVTIITDIANPGPMEIENFGPTNFVEVGYATATYVHEIPVGESYIIPLHQNTTAVYLKADTAACRVKLRIRSQ